MTGTALLITVLALGAGPDPELTSEAYLGEVTRHLYRWHLDEDDIRSEVNRGEFVFWIRELSKELDAGDESRFAEIVLPRIGVRVRVKKADYAIPKLGIEVHNERHMITSISELAPVETPPPAGMTEVRLDYEHMRDHLFRTRSHLVPPDGALLGHMRLAARDQTRRYLATHGKPIPTAPQTLHLAPISPVANEVWVFWEEGRLLYRFHADIDLDDPAVWKHQDLTVELFDLDEQVVVSLDEVAGSNAYVTRDMVGRVLFNCVVLGRREMITPDGLQASGDE